MVGRDRGGRGGRGRGRGCGNKFTRRKADNPSPNGDGEKKINEKKQKKGKQKNSKTCDQLKKGEEAASTSRRRSARSLNEQHGNQSITRTTPIKDLCESMKSNNETSQKTKDQVTLTYIISNAIGADLAQSAHIAEGEEVLQPKDLSRLYTDLQADQ